MAVQAESIHRDGLKNYVVLGLTTLAALGSIFAAVRIMPSFLDPNAYAITRAAEGIAGLFFAVLYILLGYKPQKYPFIWEIAITHRAILLIGNVMLVIGGAVGAATALIRDFVIAALLVGAYLYAKGYLAWRND